MALLVLLAPDGEQHGPLRTQAEGRSDRPPAVEARQPQRGSVAPTSHHHDAAGIDTGIPNGTRGDGLADGVEVASLLSRRSTDLTTARLWRGTLLLRSASWAYGVLTKLTSVGRRADFAATRPQIDASIRVQWTTSGSNSRMALRTCRTARPYATGFEGSKVRTPQAARSSSRLPGFSSTTACAKRAGALRRRIASSETSAPP
jgi:hypothetical protein